MSEEPKDAGEQLFSDSTVQCDEWQVRQLTQQMTGYYDDVPTVALDLADAPQTEPHTLADTPVDQPPTSAVIDPAPPASHAHRPKHEPTSVPRAPLHWLYLLGLLVAFGVYLVCITPW